MRKSIKVIKNWIFFVWDFHQIDKFIHLPSNEEQRKWSELGELIYYFWDASLYQDQTWSYVQIRSDFFFQKESLWLGQFINFFWSGVDS